MAYTEGVAPLHTNPAENDPRLAAKVRSLAERKRIFDILSTIVMVPALAAYIWNGLHIQQDVLPVWVTANLRVWVFAFVGIGLIRYYVLRCPRCGTNLNRGKSRQLYRALPGACRECGLVLGTPRPMRRSGERPISADVVSPADTDILVSGRKPKTEVRPQVAAFAGIVVGSILYYIGAQNGDWVQGLAIGGAAGIIIFFLFRGLGTRLRTFHACPSCAATGQTGKFCDNCGASMAKSSMPSTPLNP